jgi:hypothetical protein
MLVVFHFLARGFFADRSYLEGINFKSRVGAWQASLKHEQNPLLKKSDASITAPHVLSSPDPEYTKEAADITLRGRRFWA